MTTLPKPKYCGQDWLKMTPTDGGRICGHCTVFTQKALAENGLGFFCVLLVDFVVYLWSGGCVYLLKPRSN